jgi:hypothetical protein
LAFANTDTLSNIFDSSVLTEKSFTLIFYLPPIIVKQHFGLPEEYVAVGQVDDVSK